MKRFGSETSDSKRTDHGDDRTRITILVDNEVSPGFDLGAEHGFAALVERGSERILFDTGQGHALEKNASALGISLTGLSLIVLSHGHYDHTGGLSVAAALNPGIRVVGHAAIFSPHVKVDEAGKKPRKIGIPDSRNGLETAGAVFSLVSDAGYIAAKVWFSGRVPRVYETRSDKRLATIVDGNIVPDPLEDDCSVVVDTASGLVLMLGCAHAGVRNILEHARASLGIDRIFAVIGGTHLGMSDKSETLAAIEAFERFDVQILAPLHCTGSVPKAVLKAHFRDRFRDAAAGTVFEF